MFQSTIISLAFSVISVQAFISSSQRDSSYSRLSMISDGRKPFMGGNWKLNPRSVLASTNLASELVTLTKDTTNVDIAIFPPHPFLVPVMDKIRGTHVKLGGQNCFFEDAGAYTGTVSTCMLKDVGAEYVLCGHSERRILFRDDDRAISRKVQKVLKEGLRPVLCIGETKEEYDSGLNHEVCAIQIMKDLVDVTPEEMSRVIFAYEPVWAIGTGLVCPKEVAQEVHQYIRSRIAKKYGDEIARKSIIQYGGSVKADNVKELMAMPDIDGCLVGGASLTADSFAQIINYQKL